MDKNESGLDRGIRIVLAVVFFFLGVVVFVGVGSVIAYVFGVVMLVTAIIGFCGLYKVFGINTNSDKK